MDDYDTTFLFVPMPEDERIAWWWMAKIYGFNDKMANMMKVWGY